MTEVHRGHEKWGELALHGSGVSLRGIGYHDWIGGRTESSLCLRQHHEKALRQTNNNQQERRGAVFG